LFDKNRCLLFTILIFFPVEACNSTIERTKTLNGALNDYLWTRPEQARDRRWSGVAEKIKLKNVIDYLEKFFDVAEDADKSRIARVIELLKRCKDYEIEVK